MPLDRPAAHDAARRMTNDEWCEFLASETAKAIGEWLESRGKLDHPIHRLTMPELRGMASAATARWVVLSSIRLQERAEARDELGWIIWG